MQREQFKQWLESKGIRGYSNYISRLKKVEAFEGNLDEHFDEDQCAALLLKFQYTTDDRDNKSEPRHKIEIVPNSSGKDLYKSYYEDTKDFQSRIIKYIEYKKEALGITVKKDTLIQDLINTCHHLVEEGKRPSSDELTKGYKLFQQKFNPTVLKELQGEEIINTVFDIGNREGLTYWLEFKNDEEFNSSAFGSIAGGSSFKYIMYKRNADGVWVTGNPQNPTTLSVKEAIELGEELRNALCHGAMIIEKMPSNLTGEDYVKLQSALSEALINNMENYGWIHKYFHMIYPEKIDAFHNTRWHKHCLVSAGLKPKGEEMYVLSGQLMSLVKKVELPTAMVMAGMVEYFGHPVNYYRIGTGNNDYDQWPSMKAESYAGLGWSYLGNLDNMPDGKERKALIVEMMKTNQNYNQRTASQKANEVIRFYQKIESGDIVIASKGETVYGVGQISGGYKFEVERDYSHCKDIEWLRIFKEGVKLPNPREGLQTSCAEMKDIDNLLAIESMIKEADSFEPEKEIEVKLPLLSGILADIENVLLRKKQVVLYGPPGTGKTYHAELACNELAARSVFKKSFISLTESEKEIIFGDERTTGHVRICCFHPTYGYEDFIEGIKPRIENGQTLFEMKDGIFKEICNKARKKPKEKFYLIIDEINRGDISRIFGELIMLIESGKRGKTLLLPLSNEPFSVPENVYIVGTMNTADRSIALLDVALRRRFGFIELMPDYSLLFDIVFEGLPLSKWLSGLNNRICEFIGKDARNLQIGHSYFMERAKPITEKDKFIKVIKEDVIPLVEEYCYGDYAMLSKVLGDGIVDSKRQIIRESIFEGSDISSLVSALLEPSPEIRIGKEEVEEDIDEIFEVGEE